MVSGFLRHKKEKVRVNKTNECRFIYTLEQPKKAISNVNSMNIILVDFNEHNSL